MTSVAVRVTSGGVSGRASSDTLGGGGEGGGGGMDGGGMGGGFVSGVDESHRSDVGQRSLSTIHRVYTKYSDGPCEQRVADFISEQSPTPG